MAKRSFDLNVNESGYHTQCPDCRGAVCKPAGRLVEWQDDWPPQSKVPHAGTRWLHPEYGEVEVYSGVPIKTYPIDAEWQVDVIVPDLRRFRTRISLLKPIPEKPETASGEVVGTFIVGPKVKSVQVDGFSEGTYKIIKEDK